MEQAYRPTGWLRSIVAFSGGTMKRRKTIVLGTALWVAAAGASPALAQTTWQNYSCGDGSQFIVGFFQYDKRAHMQIDGKAVTLGKRLTLSGSRYSGRGVTLTIGRAGARLKHGKRPATACVVI
ncbi:MAG: lysozyme inhibitor [Bradyrhizobium sp.]|nr:lysozyme inhibitor [Bradyrhizobium sp.]